MEGKKSTEWSTLWKKDDWMSIWIGFLILIVFISGVTFKLPTWKWMTDGAFFDRVSGWEAKVEKLAKDAEAKGETTLSASVESLKSAFDAKDRNAIGDAAGKLEKASKDTKDKDLKQNSEKIAKDVKTNASATIGNVISRDNLLKALYFFIVLWILGTVGVAAMGTGVTRFITGFPIVFIIAAIAFFISGNTTITNYGLEVVFWALILGLIISNVVTVPQWLKAAVKTEYFIKIGLVLYGAEVLFSAVLKHGGRGIIQAVFVIIAVFYACYWISKKFGLDDEFSSILATGVSVCGVSAAIAAGGAIKGDPKKVSHTISLILLCAIPMLVLEPVIAKTAGMPQEVAGAWIGGTIDTTGAVVAAGGLVGETAMQVANVVKMSQNVFIGVVAFLLALWFTLKRKESGGKPSLMEIWFGFPKFVLGFLAASLVFSFLMTEADAKAVTSITSGFRAWWFTLAFVSIGLETKFKELASMGGGKPAAAFLLAQAFNILWTLGLAYLIFGGILFTC